MVGRGKIETRLCQFPVGALAPFLSASFHFPFLVFLSRSALSFQSFMIASLAPVLSCLCSQDFPKFSFVCASFSLFSFPFSRLVLLLWFLFSLLESDLGHLKNLHRYNGVNPAQGFQAGGAAGGAGYGGAY